MLQRAKDREEFYNTPVPREERKSFVAVTSALLGYVFIYAVIYGGGVLGSGLFLGEALKAALSAALLLGLLATTGGIIAARSGLTFGLLVRYSFGRSGVWIPCVLQPAIAIIWFGITVSFVADITATRATSTELDKPSPLSAPLVPHAHVELITMGLLEPPAVVPKLLNSPFLWENPPLLI